MMSTREIDRGLILVVIWRWYRDGATDSIGNQRVVVYDSLVIGERGIQRGIYFGEGVLEGG